MKSRPGNPAVALAVHSRLGWPDAAMSFRMTLYAQSCSLCYTQAASSTTRFIQALRSGILILMLPPMCLSIAVTLVAYKRRNQFYQH